MRLYAKIGEDLSEVSQNKARIKNNDTVITEKLSIAAYVEIVESNKNIYLYRYDRDGNIVGDTWHLTIDEAKKQAHYEYGIENDQWTER